MDTIPWDAVGYGSGWALVAMFVVMLFRGLTSGAIIPGTTHREIVADKNERIAKQAELIDHLTKQNSLMLESAIPTVNSLATALRQAGEI